MMFRFAIAFLVSWVAVGALPVQAASKYSDLGGRFSVTVPEGWRTVTPDLKSRIGLVMGKQSGNDFYICVVIVSDTPLTKSKSQADIDSDLAAEMTKEFWESIYKALGSTEVIIQEVGSRDQDGRKVLFVVAEFTPKGEDATTGRFKGREEVHALPGRMHDVGCTTKLNLYEDAKADFETIFNSYTPQSGLIAQAPAPQNSVATLFANTSFNGVARVVSSDTPNVASLGWTAQTGSLTISGYGEWQICEGPNYSGKCLLVVGARSAPPHSFMNVGSLRPHLSSSSRGAASVVATDTMLIVNEAVKQMSRRP